MFSMPESRRQDTPAYEKLSSPLPSPSDSRSRAALTRRRGRPQTSACSSSDYCSLSAANVLRRSAQFFTQQRAAMTALPAPRHAPFYSLMPFADTGICRLPCYTPCAAIATLMPLCRHAAAMPMPFFDAF